MSSEETRDRIATAIGELGHRRNQSARTFRRQRTDTVGVLAIGPLNGKGTTPMITISDHTSGNGAVASARSRSARTRPPSTCWG